MTMFFSQQNYSKSLFFSLTLPIAIALELLSATSMKAAEWEEILERGNLVVGVKDNLRPLGYIDSEGNLQGFEIDLARRIAQELLGNQEAIELIPVLNQERLELVTEDQVDLVIASMTINPSRQRLVDFSDYYFISGTGIITKKSSVPLNMQASSSKIGVLENSRAIAQIKYNLPQVKLIPVTCYQEASQLLERGEIQGFAGDLVVLAGWKQENPQLEILSTVYGGYPLAVAMPKGRQYQSLRDKVNRVVRQLKQEGWLSEKAKYWGLSDFN